MSTSRWLLWLAWTAAGLLIGLGTAFAVLAVTAIFLPHCGAACDDTMPEAFAAGAAYATWLLTAVATSVLAWRHLADR